MEKFILINNERNRIKVFEPFEDVSKPSPSIDAMMISYGCVYKRSSKPVMKGSRVETIEAARKEYAKLLKEGQWWLNHREMPHLCLTPCHDGDSGSSRQLMQGCEKKTYGTFSFVISFHRRYPGHVSIILYKIILNYMIWNNAQSIYITWYQNFVFIFVKHSNHYNSYEKCSAGLREREQKKNYL